MTRPDHTVPTGSSHGEGPPETAAKATTTSASADPSAAAENPHRESGDTTRAEGARTSSAEEEITTLVYHLEFGIGKSLRYHAKRRSWFENWHRAGMASAVVSATAAFVTVANQFPEIARWVALVSATLTAADLIIGFHRHADLHSRLYQRFSSLAAEIAGVSHPTEERYRGWKAERLRIEGEEPSSLDTLNVICHNEEAEARGIGPEYRHYVARIDRWLAQIISFRSDYPTLESTSKS